MNPVFLSNNGIGLRLEPDGTGVRGQIVGDGDSLIFTNPGSTTVYVAIGGPGIVSRGQIRGNIRIPIFLTTFTCSGDERRR